MPPLRGLARKGSFPAGRLAASLDAAYAGSVDFTDPDILLALGLLVLVGLRLCAFQSSRAIARAGLARLAGRGGGRAAAAPVSVVLLWVASMALAVQLTAHYGAGAPEALLPLREFAASVGALPRRSPREGSGSSARHDRRHPGRSSGTRGCRRRRSASGCRPRRPRCKRSTRASSNSTPKRARAFVPGRGMRGGNPGRYELEESRPGQKRWPADAGGLNVISQ